jgi:hypothetical protein
MNYIANHKQTFKTRVFEKNKMFYCENDLYFKNLKINK